METQFPTTDLNHLDPHSLEKIALIAEQAKRTLLLGISTIRRLDAPPMSQQAVDSAQMVAQLSRLTLMWDEIHYRTTQLLSTLPLLDEWPSITKPPPMTLH
ncbi:MAG: hypothetical protein H7839_14550 [Magnetococcus sp. YQC-5]